MSHYPSHVLKRIMKEAEDRVAAGQSSSRSPRYQLPTQSVVAHLEAKTIKGTVNLQ